RRRREPSVVCIDYWKPRDHSARKNVRIESSFTLLKLNGRLIMSDPNQEFQVPPAPAITEQKVVRATKLLPYAIGLFVIGVIVCVAGIIKLIPGGIGTGAAFAFWGILLFAYSFIP